MKRKTRKFACFLLLASILSSCTNVVPPIKEINVSSTPIVTATFSPTMTYTTSPTQRQAIATWYLKTATPILPTPPPDDIGYYEGIIVITQYYTLLGHGLYEEAYQLLSSSAQVYPLEDYVKYMQQTFKKVKIQTILPYPVFVKKQGGNLRTFDSMNRRRFYIQIIAWGEGRMSGSAMNGEAQTLFLRLIIEDGEWRISEFGTSPLS